MMRSFGLAMLGAFAACSQQSVEPLASQSGVRAELRNAENRVVATAVASANGGLTISVEATALAPGSYGLHLHAMGRCDPPAFDSAGAHWNPAGRRHGRLNPDGPHLGDLPNLVVGSDGRGSVRFTLEGASVFAGQALLDEDGTALVIHAMPDDYRTDPTGNSGRRIACGVFGARLPS